MIIITVSHSPQNSYHRRLQDSVQMIKLSIKDQNRLFRNVFNFGKWVDFSMNDVSIALMFDLCKGFEDEKLFLAIVDGFDRASIIPKAGMPFGTRKQLDFDSSHRLSFIAAKFSQIRTSQNQPSAFRHLDKSSPVYN
jgi:hypothetical protein